MVSLSSSASPSTDARYSYYASPLAADRLLHHTAATLTHSPFHLMGQMEFLYVQFTESQTHRLISKTQARRETESGAPMYPPQSPLATSSKSLNQTHGSQPGASMYSPQSHSSTPSGTAHHASHEQLGAPMYPPQSPLSTPARSINQISRVPVGTRASYPPKVQETVSVAEVY